MVFNSQLSSELQVFFTLHDPNYLLGFQAGYECAKVEMEEFLKQMKAMVESTSTVTTSSPQRRR